MGGEVVKLSRGYDWRVSLKKAALAVAFVGVMGVLDHFADKAEAAKLIPPGPYQEIIVLAVAGAARYGGNYLKNRKR